MNAMLLNPRTATALAIAKAQAPYSTWGPAAPDPAAIRQLGHDRFGIDLTDSEIRDAIKAVAR